MGTQRGGQSQDSLRHGRESPSDAIGQTALDRLFRKIGHVQGPETALASKPKRSDVIEIAIKRHVIPKLAVLHSQDTPVPSEAPRLGVVSPDVIQNFTRQILAHDLQGCVDFVEHLAEQGHSLAQICVDVLTPAARDLGLMWEDDAVSFVDVTTGLGLLHTLLYRLAEMFRSSAAMVDPTRQVLLASLSGEQHNFGLHMVAELFRQSRWAVTVEPSISEADLARLVKETSFAIVGLSLADATQTARLAHAIRQLRKASVNPAIGVIVGGPVFVTEPDLAALIGADLTAHDAEQAVFRAEGLRVLLATWA